MWEPSEKNVHKILLRKTGSISILDSCSEAKKKKRKKEKQILKAKIYENCAAKR